MPINGVQWLAAFQHIVFGDEDDVTFRQKFVISAGFLQVGIQHAAIIARPSGVGARIIPLDFNVVGAVFAINSKNVQPDVMTVHVVQFHLGGYMFHHQIRFPKNDPQHQLHTFCIVLEAGLHEAIVHQPQLPNPFPDGFRAKRRMGRNCVVVVRFVERHVCSSVTDAFTMFSTGAVVNTVPDDFPAWWKVYLFLRGEANSPQERA